MEVIYGGAKLDIHPVLAKVWPYEKWPEQWATFCGAGNGFGDWLIPENPRGIDCSCCCADHDIRWIFAKNRKEAYAANKILRKNLEAFILKRREKHQYYMTAAGIKLDNTRTKLRCWQWYTGVQWGVTFCFEPVNDEYAIRKEVEQKLARVLE